MPRSAPPTRQSWAILITVEDGAPFPVVRVGTNAPSSDRAGRIGPLAAHDGILGDLLAWANARALIDGANGPIGRNGSWRFSTQVRRDDLDPVRKGLRCLLHNGDEEPLRILFNSKHPHKEPGRQVAPIITR
jgi:hypothetical protein